MQPQPVVESGKGKLTFTQRYELERLPAQIEALEDEQRDLNERVMSDGFYDQPPVAVRAVADRLDELSAQLLELYSRWDELDALS